MPSRSARTRTVRCPDCGSSRIVSLEQALRIEKGLFRAQCPLCRRPASLAVTEAHRRWWLRQHGVPARALAGPGGAERYVREHGLPESLQALVASAMIPPGH